MGILDHLRLYKVAIQPVYRDYQKLLKQKWVSIDPTNNSAERIDKCEHGRSITDLHIIHDTISNLLKIKKKYRKTRTKCRYETYICHSPKNASVTKFSGAGSSGH